MTQKLGILGGTFNPIHYGHLAAAEQVRDSLKLDRVLFVPAYMPPHKYEEDIPSAEQRREMVRLAISENPLFAISDIEIERKGKSYTIDTIETLRAAYPGAELYFITGLDSFLEIRTWKEWERLLDRCCFIVLSRPGYWFMDLLKLDFMKQAEKELRALDAKEMTRAVAQSGNKKIYLELIPHYEISSTDIRKRVRQARTIKYHLPVSVETYIIEHTLYA